MDPETQGGGGGVFLTVNNLKEAELLPGFRLPPTPQRNCHFHASQSSKPV